MSLNPVSIKRIRNNSSGMDQGSPDLKKMNTNFGTTLLNDNMDQKQLKRTIGKLYSLRDENPHEIIPYKSKIIIGRSRHSDIIIKGADISQKHVELIPVWNEAIGEVFLNLVDTSTNGTWVNESRVSNDLILLKDGDKIKLAKTAEYIFRYSRNLNGQAEQQSGSSGMNSNKLFKSDYILGKVLGSGHYATVNEAIHKSSGTKYAVKIFKPQKIDDVKQSKKFNQELEVLMSINHENIVKLIDKYVEPINKFSITTYLVLEKVNGGELFTRIVNKKFLHPDETKAIFTQLMKGLKYLHGRGITHRDIKPENILLDIKLRTSPDQVQTGPWDPEELDVVVKIADFGLAKFIGNLEFTNTLCGTPAYVAPEVFEQQRKYTEKVDLWSAGVLLYVCLVGFPPFSEELGPPSMRDQIRSCKYAFYSPYFDHVEDICLDLITRLLVKDPSGRFNVDQVLSHPWLVETSSTELVKKQNDDDGDVSMSIDRSPLKNSQRAPITYSELSHLGN